MPLSEFIATFANNTIRNIRYHKKMDKESVNDKIEYIVMFISEFSKRHHLTGRQAYCYLKEFGGVELLDSFYDVMHTQSFENMVTDVTTFCHRKGGALQ